MTFTDAQLTFLDAQRVGHLATSDSRNRPHVVPVCYACDGESLFVALDAKPKRVAPERLKRVRNILDNPEVALVIDRYSEDWRQLAYVLIRGAAALLAPGAPEQHTAVALLRGRYPQYRTMALEEQPAIAIRPSSVVMWNAGDS